MAIGRGAFRSMMFTAFKQGFSFNAFYRSSQEHGTSYRRSDMLSDWATVKNVIVNTKRVQATASGAILEHVEWWRPEDTQRPEYLYKTTVTYVPQRGGPAVTRIVSVSSDEPLTKGGVIEEVYLRWPKWGSPRETNIRSVEPFAAIKYVTE